MDESSEDSVLDETTEDATRLDETSDDDSVTVKSSKNTKTKLPSTKKVAAVSKSTKAGLKFPVSRFQRYLRKGNYADHIGTAAAVYMSSVLEYLTAEILELSGQAAEDNKKVRITPRHVMLAIKNDAELNELLNGAQFAGSGVIPNINPVLFKNKSKKRANNSVDGDDDAEPLSSQIY